MKQTGLSNVIDLERARSQDRGEDPRPPRTAGPPGLAKKGRAKRVVAVGGGKGGIGKTLVSANLSIALAQKGFRVAVVDADLGGANLHT